ncbi:hypothetical protein E2C01_029463 [Portunus trituberculatus]|uniref:Uncharacterized protein n=1 Tax=Portunus trituberculatus TaxID=210409 RepID=A0A5B7EN12_PORTR|nr:hypothetical protein [Portunus trituberculatus]
MGQIVNSCCNVMSLCHEEEESCPVICLFFARLFLLLTDLNESNAKIPTKITIPIYHNVT